MIGDRALFDQRDVARLIALLEADRAEALTIAELRGHGIEAPSQAIYSLQLAGYQIDRVAVRRANGRSTTGYRLGLHPPAQTGVRRAVEGGG